VDTGQRAISHEGQARPRRCLFVFLGQTLRVRRWDSTNGLFIFRLPDPGPASSGASATGYK